MKMNMDKSTKFEALAVAVEEAVEDGKKKRPDFRTYLENKRKETERNTKMR
jgi:hypothetical protein